jgi:hypothetical protein
MRHKSTGQHAAPDTDPNVIDLGARRRLWRKPPSLPEVPQTPDLTHGSLLGYLYDRAAFEVTLGSRHNLFLKTCEDVPRKLRYFEEFTQLRYVMFAQIDWRNGKTSFTYGGGRDTPRYMALHSPEEAALLRLALVLYWHMAKGRHIVEVDAVFPNPTPEYGNDHEPLGWPA